jgi:hypothetical protein
VPSHAIQFANAHHFGLIFVGVGEDHRLGCKVASLGKWMLKGIVRYFSFCAGLVGEVKGEVRMLGGVGIWGEDDRRGYKFAPSGELISIRRHYGL